MRDLRAPVVHGSLVPDADFAGRESRVHSRGECHKRAVPRRHGGKCLFLCHRGCRFVGGAVCVLAQLEDKFARLCLQLALESGSLFNVF